MSAEQQATSDQHQQDSADLAQFGYKQELKRSLGLGSSFAVAFSYISPLTGIFTPRVSSPLTSIASPLISPRSTTWAGMAKMEGPTLNQLVAAPSGSLWRESSIV